MRIYLQGDKVTANWHLPVIKAKVSDFVSRCKARGLKQNTFAFTFTETGTEVFAQYIFGQVSIQVYSPEKTVTSVIEKQEGLVFAPEIVVIAGDEVGGYNIALIPENGNEPKYYTALTFEKIIGIFPPAAQRELYSRRYSLKTDRNAYVAQEYLLENYASAGLINLLSGSTPGDKCLPTISVRCPELPAAGSTIYQCQELSSISIPLLDYLGAVDVTQEIATGFTARAWCYSRNTGTYRSYWGHKREVTSCCVGSCGRVDFGGAVTVRGTEQGNNYSTLLETFYTLYASEYSCNSSWADVGVIAENVAVGYGTLNVEKPNTPAGPATVICSGVKERIHSFYNSDEDSFAYGHSEPFTAGISSTEMDGIIASNEGESNLLYAYSDPAVFSSHTTSSASFYCPLTKYVSAKNTPGFVNTFNGTNEDGLVTYNNIEAKTIALATEYKGQKYEIYFSNFLEGKFTYSAGSYSKSDVQQVSIGRCKIPFGNKDVILQRLDEVFKAFREKDITAGKITVDDVVPVYGSVMCYLYRNDEYAAYLKDELRMFVLINELRDSLGIAPLALNLNLCVAARIHATDMATNNFLGHTGTDGSTVGQRIDGTAFCGGAVEFLTLGENCGMGYTSASAQIQGWITSTEGHYEAMVNTKFLEIGLALAVRYNIDGTTTAYRCAVFTGDNAL